MDDEDREFVNKILEEQGKELIKKRTYDFEVLDVERDYVREFMDTYML